MKLLIDTNVVLDVLLKREPFFQAAADVLNLSLRNDVQEYISASAVTNLYCIAHRQLKGKTAVRGLLKRLPQVVAVAAVSEHEIICTLKLGWNDFEDSVQYSVALRNEMDGLVTRNPKDYVNAEIPIWEPEQILQKFSTEQ